MKQALRDPILILLLLIGAFLIFANLGNMYLWQDEAETAQVAKNTLAFGFPRGYDGKNVLQVTGGLGDNFIWVYHSWFQFYLTAFSFLIFGLNTFAARFPFAVLGFLSIFLTYRLSWCLFEDKNISRIATLLLVFSVPFLLHLRQCRYFSLTVFAVLLTLLYYLGFVENKKFSTAKLAICFIFLFHSNHGAFIPVFIVLFLHYIVFTFKNKDLKRLLTLCTLISLFTLPWLFWLKSWHQGQSALTFRHLRRHFEFYIRTTNKYVFPIAFFSIAAVIYMAIKRKWPSLPVHINKARFWLIVLTIAASIGFLLFVEQRHFRYIVYLIPLLLIIEAIILSRWWKINRYLTAAVILVLLLTNVFNNPKIRFPLFEYLYEITHDYDGPNEGIVKFLRKNANPQDIVKVPYGSAPTIFYTNLYVDSRPFFENETYPEWIVFRKDWIDGQGLKSRYFQEIARRYEKIVINYPDIMWGNRPEPGYHKFKTVADAPKVVIYRRK